MYRNYNESSIHYSTTNTVPYKPCSILKYLAAHVQLVSYTIKKILCTKIQIHKLTLINQKNF